MKPKRLRSMRDIPTIQGLKNRGVPSNREQIVGELARLEHEKARLERELSMWTANQKKTESRIQQVQERLNMLGDVMDSISPRRHRPDSDQSDEPAQKTEKYQEMSLEY
jgi:hypothetical protein